MENLIKRLALGLSGFMFIFLLTAFYSVSLDITQWSEDIRGLCVTFGGLVFFGLVTFPYDEI